MCYTRTTGIWQTVWLEAADQNHIKSVSIVPNLKTSCFEFSPQFSTNVNDNFKVDISFKNKKISSSTFSTNLKKN